MKFVQLSVEELTEALQEFEQFHVQFSPCFHTKTHTVSQHAGQYIQGQLVCLERGTMTNLTKVVPNSHAQAFQHFLSDSPWADDAVIEPLQHEVTHLIGDAHDGAIHLDESGFPTHGKASVGVTRQDCGRLGKVDTCQMGVFLGYPHGTYRTLIDRRLYVPEEWVEDPERRQKAGGPDDITFQTNAQLGLAMLKDALRRGLPFGWVGMDGHDGQQPWLLRELDTLSVVYIADIPCDTRVWLERPPTAIPARHGSRGRLPSTERGCPEAPEPCEVQTMAAHLPPEAWHRVWLRESERKELWGRVAVLRVVPVWDDLPGPEQWVVIRQNDGEQTLTYHLSHALPTTSVARLGQMSVSR
jgi:SRSO17 transposase